jgi:hypothetical protein
VVSALVEVEAGVEEVVEGVVSELDEPELLEDPVDPEAAVGAELEVGIVTEVANVSSATVVEVETLACWVMEDRARTEADLEVFALHADFDFFDAEAVPFANGAEEASRAAAEVIPDDGLEATEVAATDVATGADEASVVTAAAEDAAVPTGATEVAEASRVWDMLTAPV